MVAVFLSYGSPVATTKTRLFLVFLTMVEEVIEVIYRDLVMMVTAEYDKKMSLPTAVGISNSAGHGSGAPGPSRGIDYPQVSVVPTMDSPTSAFPESSWPLLEIATLKVFYKLLLCRGIYLLTLTSLRTFFTGNLRRVISLDSEHGICIINVSFFLFLFLFFLLTAPLQPVPGPGASSLRLTCLKRDFC